MHKSIATALLVASTLLLSNPSAYADGQTVSYGGAIHAMAAQAGVSTECLASIVSVSHVEELGERAFQCTDAEWRTLTRNCTEPSPTTLRCAVGRYEVTFSSHGDIIWVNKER